MRIEIDIPKEFEEHFKQDKFKDSLERIMADLENSLCAGRYEYETIEMLEEALENSKTAYDVDKVVEQLEKHKDTADLTTVDEEMVLGFTIYQGAFNEAIDNAIEIVKQGGDDNGVCECRKLKDYRSLFKTSCGYIFAREGFKYCPYCGKEIKITN